MNLASAPQVKKLLAEHRLHPKKRLGQNFLIDRNTLDKIADASEVASGSNVLEIGPGLGTVTRELVLRGAKVVCVEADKDLRPILEKTLAGDPNAELVLEDFLKIDLPEFLRTRADGKWVVVGNLPYYITSPIIAKLLDSRHLISRILLMVQREVADRLRAEPGFGDYGSLTVFVRYYCDIDSVMRVSRNVFYPVPDVDSEFVRLTVLERPRFEARNEGLFFGIVRSAFGKRRKTLLNSLGTSDELGWGKDRARQVLEAAGIDAERRGETLSIEEFVELANVAAESEEQ
jgi:16S rRNA (adenine1518-N6/adenine1519-N6)-dimethyltransferase